MGLQFDSRAAFLEYLRPTTDYQVLIQTLLVDRHRARATTTIHELVKGVAETGSALNAPGEEVNVDQYGIYFAGRRRVEIHARSWANRALRPRPPATGTRGAPIVNP